MNKLIIRHGERLTEHLLGDHPLVVGRDPQCDLFFADKKLSRRHARFERDGRAVRLVDLGSRNGSWVNEERIDETTLASGDAVRLGALKISLELEEEASRDDEDSTVFITSESSADDSHTVVLSKDAAPDASATTSEPSADDSRTIVLSKDAAPDAAAQTAGEASADDGGDGTVLLPKTPDAATAEVSLSELESEGQDSPAPRDDDDDDDDPTLQKADSAPDRTVVLTGQSARPSFTDTGTVIFRGKVDPEIEAATRAATREEVQDEAASDSATRLASAPADVPPPAVRAHDEGEAVTALRPGRLSLTSPLRFGLLVAAVVLLAFSVLALPLIGTLGNALRMESALRGDLLVELLAATNAPALRSGTAGAVSVDRVTGEPGVRAAFVLDANGNALASFGDAGGRTALAPLGADVRPSSIRTLRKSQMDDGATLLAQPILRDGRLLGLAVVHYQADPSGSSRTTLMVFLGAVLLLMGVAGALLMARRWILEPVRTLRDDVEALAQGYLGTLPEEQPDSDLVVIARSFNELMRQRSDGGDASATFKPVVDPTFVPDD